jgi:excinuclease UvrABC nuclease subunit
MFKNKPDTTPSELEKSITAAIKQLEFVPAYSDEYANIITAIEKMTALSATKQRQPVSSDTIALIVGNLVGIVAILQFEKAGVVTSKALSFVMKASR